MSKPHAWTFVQFRSGRRGVPAPRSFEKWVDAAIASTRRSWQVNVVLFGTVEARGLNRRFRGKDYATNVLSFPYDSPAKRSAAPPLLGDLVICPAVVRREAAAQGKPVRDHFAHLTVHGVLHLLGHDHESPADAERMEALERRILRGLGIPDPYEIR
jgi:probable rRNA maturation factor